jgi:UDP-N-acetylglucosamine:LPS N-acetylglucosamine transferase
LVFDTVVPKRDVPPDISLVYVMRKIRTEERGRFFGHPLVQRASAIVVPHTRDEEDDEWPRELVSRTHWVGPIVRIPSRGVQDVLRAKYHLVDGDFVVTSTAGGGGRQESGFAFDTIGRVHQRLRTEILGLRHFVVTGPYSRSPLPLLDGAVLLRFEPAINDLFAVSDVVIAEGGYNTVHEVRLARVPAIFLPTGRKLDNQEERVRALERRGLCVVYTEGSQDVVEGIVRTCTSRSALDAMRRNYLADTFETGNRAAAQLLIDVASRVCRA